MMSASPVVSIQPDQGGSVQLLLATLVDDAPAVADGAAAGAAAEWLWAGCACDGAVVPAWETMSSERAGTAHGDDDGECGCDVDGMRGAGDDEGGEQESKVCKKEK